MNRKILLIFAVFASFCVILSSIFAYYAVDGLARYKIQENIEKQAAKKAKDILKGLFEMVENTYKTDGLNKFEVYELIKKEVNKINLNNHFVKLYAFNESGFYIVHYLKDYENLNAFLEKDISGKRYIKELINRKNFDKIYVKNTIFSQNYLLKHTLTFVKKDKIFNIYYACVVDLDDDANKKYNFDENLFKKIKIYFLLISLCFVSALTFLYFKESK